MGRQLPVTVAFAAVLERSFPDEYEARRRESAAELAGAAGAGQDDAPVPLFVMSIMLPGALLEVLPAYRYEEETRPVNKVLRDLDLLSVFKGAMTKNISCIWH